jgi:uncharacterized protein (DUF2147 family)
MTNGFILATLSRRSGELRAGLLERQMNTFWKAGLGLAMAAAMTAPSVAQAVDVTGMWRPDKNSDYEMSMCGKDNAQLCIKVVALRGNMDSDKNRPYLNTYLIDKAKPSGAGRWKGKLSLFGQTGDATLTLKGTNTMNVKACAYIVVCREITLTRVQ